MKIRLKNLDNNYHGYQQLIDLIESTNGAQLDQVHVEIAGMFPINLCAALGAAFDRIVQRLGTVNIRTLKPEMEHLLLKNRFLYYYGTQHVSGDSKVALNFTKLKSTDGKYFRNNIVAEILKTDFAPHPQNGVSVKDKIVESIYEVFVNAQIHSETEYIYVSGSYNPESGEMLFTIVDAGIGFQHKVNKRFGSRLTSVQALQWALQQNTTTKKQISGGLGLTILREFCGKNKGVLQIVTGDSFYQHKSNRETFQHFKGYFPGTLVTLLIKTDDLQDYSLPDGINIDDIF